MTLIRTARHTATLFTALLASAVAAQTGGVEQAVEDAVQDVRDAAAETTAVVEAWFHAQVTRASRVIAPESGAFLLTVTDESAPEGPSVAWTSVGTAVEVPDHLVVLVHGLDEPGDIWDDLAPVLHAQGFRVARFEYPNDQDPGASAEILYESLLDLKARGVTDVSFVCHSMGGLVTRDTLTRSGMYGSQARGHVELPDVHHLITVGTPNLGSPVAALQPVAEAREQVMRWLDGDLTDTARLRAHQHDGLGEAAIALAEGSLYLTDLNSRPLPEDVHITTIAGMLAPGAAAPVRTVTRSALASRLVPASLLRRIEKEADAAVAELGDGVVPLESAQLPGVADTVTLMADHRAMLRLMPVHRKAYEVAGMKYDEPPAIPVILDRLGQPE